LSLDLSYLVFFARPFERAEDTDRSLKLIAESGLDLPAGESVMELDWSRMPSPVDDDEAVGSRGREAVSSLISALKATAAAPEDLKGRLTKSLFLAPVEVSSSWHGVVAFGVSTGSIQPTDADYRFLYRIGRLLVRRYYSFCLAVERALLSRRVTDLEKELRVFDEERKEEERKKKRILPGQRFDLRKLLMECHDKLLPLAEAKSLPIEARELADRMVVIGERRRLRDVLHQLLAMGIERSCSDQEGQSISPLRLTLKRRERSAEVVVEVIGSFLGTGEQRRLFRRKKESTATGSKDRPRRDDAAGPPTEKREAGERAAKSESVPAVPDNDELASEREAATGSLRAVQNVIQDHRGRFRVTSERLHRFVDDEHRWMGKTTFVVELPLAPRQRPPSGDGKNEPQRPRGRRERQEGREKRGRGEEKRIDKGIDGPQRRGGRGEEIERS